MRGSERIMVSLAAMRLLFSAACGGAYTGDGNNPDTTPPPEADTPEIDVGMSPAPHDDPGPDSESATSTRESRDSGSDQGEGKTETPVARSNSVVSEDVPVPKVVEQHKGLSMFTVDDADIYHFDGWFVAYIGDGDLRVCEFDGANAKNLLDIKNQAGQTMRAYVFENWTGLSIGGETLEEYCVS